MRAYYKQRAEGGEPPRLDLNDLARMTLGVVETFRDGDCLQEAFGYHCVDEDYVRGVVGDPEIYLTRHAFTRGLWPAREDVYLQLDESTIFTLIEVLYDRVSSPIDDGDAHHHRYNSCGVHYVHFDKTEGQRRWREEVNNFLSAYGEGFELSALGEVHRVGRTGLRELMEESTAQSRETPDARIIERAIRKFRRANSSEEDRRDAVRDLAAVLERIRPKVKEQLFKKDESELYFIANNFSIRHHREGQRSEYGEELIGWIFHVYLATIRLVNDLEKREYAAPQPASLPLENEDEGEFPL